MRGNEGEGGRKGRRNVPKFNLLFYDWQDEFAALRVDKRKINEVIFIEPLRTILSPQSILKERK